MIFVFMIFVMADLTRIDSGHRNESQDEQQVHDSRQHKIGAAINRELSHEQRKPIPIHLNKIAQLKYA